MRKRGECTGHILQLAMLAPSCTWGDIHLHHCHHIRTPLKCFAPSPSIPAKNLFFCTSLRGRVPNTHIASRVEQVFCRYVLTILSKNRPCPCSRSTAQKMNLHHEPVQLGSIQKYILSTVPYKCLSHAHLVNLHATHDSE